MAGVAALFPIFLMGLLGSLHCVGMCGGIVGALSAAAGRPVIVIKAEASSASPLSPAKAPARVLAYNLGRIGSYCVAGAFAGGVAGASAMLVQVAAVQVAAYWMANLMLLLLGLYLMEAAPLLLRLEAAGQILWRRVQPLVAPLLPMDTLPKALALGALWGWLPCGMVYGVLLIALLSGSAWSGAATMFAFGLGTLPAMLGLGLAGARLRLAARKPMVRLACGALIIGFALLGMARAASGLSFGWLDALCMSTQGHP
jgi:sulfite exporter TauE/SafE